MAEIETTSTINLIRGKLKSTDPGYFYVRNGKQHYRDRAEDYQKNQSPKQKYNSDVFAYANSYMAKPTALHGHGNSTPSNTTINYPILLYNN